jgi:hypothetical protein
MKAEALNPRSYTASHPLAERLRAQASEGVVYSSTRYAQGECAALFYPDQLPSRSRVDISTITGMANGLISIGLRGPVRSIED